MRNILLIVGIFVLGLGACRKHDTEVGVTVDSSDLVSGVRWAEEAEQIERRACACREDGHECTRRFMRDLQEFKQEAGDIKVSNAIARRIRAATEAALKCATTATSHGRD